MTAHQPAHDEHTGLLAVVEASPYEEAPIRLAALLGELACASLLITPPDGQRFDVEHVRPLIAIAQRLGVAALVADDAALALALGADGVHLFRSETTLAAYVLARAMLGENRIVGADARQSRDAAMRLGEAGADYVAFGLSSGADGDEDAISRRLELVTWWADIFEVPCVAFDVGSAEEARDLSRAGADFIAVRANLNEAPELAARRVRLIGDGLGAPASIA